VVEGVDVDAVASSSRFAAASELIRSQSPPKWSASLCDAITASSAIFFSP
jgi:hypothetical protein